MMKLIDAKFSQYFPKSSQIIFTLKLNYFKQHIKLTEYLGYFCKQVYYQEVQKIAQSGHTGANSGQPLQNFRWPLSVFIYHFRNQMRVTLFGHSVCRYYYLSYTRLNVLQLIEW